MGATWYHGSHENWKIQIRSSFSKHSPGLHDPNRYRHGRHTGKHGFSSGSNNHSSKLLLLYVSCAYAQKWSWLDWGYSFPRHEYFKAKDLEESSRSRKVTLTFHSPSPWNRPLNKDFLISPLWQVLRPSHKRCPPHTHNSTNPSCRSSSHSTSVVRRLCVQEWPPG